MKNVILTHISKPRTSHFIDPKYNAKNRNGDTYGKNIDR